MKYVMGVALFCLTLLLIACSTNPRAIPASSTAHSKLAPHLSEAPTGFDNKSNGMVDDATHQDDQGKFDDTETVADGLGPLYNAQSCRECHQNPTSGGTSQVAELRVGHQGPDHLFHNPDIPIAHGTEVISEHEPGQLPKIGAVKCLFWVEREKPPLVGEASEVLRSLLGDAGFGCGLHLGLWCGRLLDLHWLNGRGLFFADAGCRCFSCSSPAHAGSCGFLSGRSTLTRRRSLLARSAPLAS
jgi:hypothetical protein